MRRDLGMDQPRNLAKDDSELSDDDIIIRYQRNKIIGFNILNVRKQ